VDTKDQAIMPAEMVGFKAEACMEAGRRVEFAQEVFVAPHDLELERRGSGRSGGAIGQENSDAANTMGLCRTRVADLGLRR